MIEICFVCTGNVFRSFSAEMLARQNLPPDQDIHFSSAGTGLVEWEKNPVQPWVCNRLLQLGCQISENYRPTPVTPELLARVDLVVAMDEKHQRTLRDQYDCTAILFREIASGETRGVLDVTDVIPGVWPPNAQGQKYMVELVEELNSLIPSFIQNVGVTLERSRKISINKRPESHQLRNKNEL